MKVKPSPNSFKKEGIFSSINFCNTLSLIFSLLLVFFITIGFLTKSVILYSCVSSKDNLYFVSSLNLSYSFDFIFSLN